ncbi:glycosyltransferase [Pontibacter pamirensis]|uniref:glycosyltransferase n=1 Tax=Pontibacter pamirensis TaxID=2562824 RepID=UPI0013898919|nr:glycosyltransferase [Pontibacter pamirensis]
MNSDIVILIPHFNNLAGLKKSLNSIHFSSKLDVLIVDDGSIVKPTLEELQKDFSGMLHLHLLFNDQNQGIEKTLNKGLAYIQSNMSCKYIARLDCGDICDSNRFVKQKHFLDTNEEVYLLGSWVEFFYKDEAIYTYRAPAKHKDIVQNMYLKCSFIHPSVMFRTKALRKIGVYPLNYKAAEDYAFFFKFVKNYKTHILPEVLTFCELNPGGISRTKRTIQQKSKIKVIKDNSSLSPYFVIGLIRNYTLLLLPYHVVAKAKALFLR